MTHPTPRALTRPWRRTGVTAAALALTAAALTVSGPVDRPVAQASAATTAIAGTGASDACLAAPDGQRVRVGSGFDGEDPNSIGLTESLAVERALEVRAPKNRLSVQRSLRATSSSTTIGVYVHVITKSDGKGGVSTKRIKQQIDVLNKAYAGTNADEGVATPFRFALKKIDTTRKSSWYDWELPTEDSDGDDVAPKAKLHQGGPSDLNLYLADLGDDLLGYSSFPWSTTLEQDGVVVLNASLPGGAAKGANSGDTVVHEVGHWLGLLHTFENGCADPGDLVDDTPAQADGDNVYSCRESLDTCDADGGDPVHNFMSYGDDKCLDRFTPGQVERMTAVWQYYRAAGTTD